VLKCSRVTHGENIAEVIMRWRGVAIWAEPAQEIELLLIEAGHAADKFLPTPALRAG
jgi:hypothetical protein